MRSNGRYHHGMADVEIPEQLADLQRRATAAFDAVAQHGRDVGRPVLEWTTEENERSAGLMTAARDAADQLRTAIDASGLEREHGSWLFNNALKAAARDTADA